MARIAGINLPNNKRVEIGLTYIHGIGKMTSQKILAQTKVDPNVRIKDLKETDVNTLRQIVEKEYLVEGALQRDKLSNIKRLKEIKSYRGSRHAKGLPVRGQKTKTNARTAHGNTRRTMGSGRKDANQKT